MVRTNYNIIKSEVSINKNRINFDYLKGIIDTDGHIDVKTRKRVVITQMHPIYLLYLKEFIEKRFKVKGKLYMNNTQLSFWSEDFFNFIINYKIEDYNKYYAGIFDGDGSLCSHWSKKNPSIKRWRMQLGASKERKLIIFREFFKFFKLNPTKYFSGKDRKAVIFSIDRKDEVEYLINKLKYFVIIKNDVFKLVLNMIEDYKTSKKKKCIYCNKMFIQSIISFGHNPQQICKDIICRRKYNRDRMRKFRVKDKDS